MKFLGYYFWIILGGILLYFKSMSFGLTYLDDHVWILDLQWYIKNLANGIQVFLQPDLISNVFYRPVLNLSFILNAQWGGESPFAYHLVNIIIHVINSCLVFKLLNQFKHDSKLSLVFALIFMVHPALTSSVAWIPGRTDSLLGLFILLAFIAFLNFLRKDQKSALFSHLFFLVLALLTKETAIVLPVLCILYFLLIDRQDETIVQIKKVILPWSLTIFAWFAVRYIVLRNSPEVPFMLALQSIGTNAPAIISYFGKMILPFNLSVLPVVQDMTLIYGYIAFGMIAVVLLLSKQRRLNYIAFGASWFLLFLLPALVISFLKHEYRLYVPAIGGIIILLEIDFFKNLATQKNRLLGFSLVIIGLFSFMTLQYSDQFKDRLTFWKNAAKTSPHSPLAHRNLGAMYYLDGELVSSEVEFKKALELNPKEPMAHNNLGLIYKTRKQFAQAEHEFQLEIAINPNYDNVYFNLGLLKYAQGHVQEAQRLWEKTLSLNPRYTDAYLNLALLYYQQGDFAAAAQNAEALQKRGIPIPQTLQLLLKQE